MSNPAQIPCIYWKSQTYPPISSFLIIKKLSQIPTDPPRRSQQIPGFWFVVKMRQDQNKTVRIGDRRPAAAMHRMPLYTMREYRGNRSKIDSSRAIVSYPLQAHLKWQTKKLGQLLQLEQNAPWNISAVGRRGEEFAQRSQFWCALLLLRWLHSTEPEQA